MDHNSMNCRNVDDVGRTSDAGDERLPSRETARTIRGTREPARNWAWAQGNESYDWMDSHSPFPTQGSRH